MPSPSVHSLYFDAVQALFGTKAHWPCSTSFQAGTDSTTEPMVPERGHPQFPDVGDPLKMKAELQRPILRRGLTTYFPGHSSGGGRLVVPLVFGFVCCGPWMACAVLYFLSYFVSCFVFYLVLYSVRVCSLQAEQSNGLDAASKNAAPVLSGLVFRLIFRLVLVFGPAIGESST